MTTQDPERLAEKLEERVPATEAEAAAMAAKIEDRLRKTEAARTLKPSERGPTNEEIIAEATRRYNAASPDCRIFSHFVIAATKDQSWFKPEPEVDESTLVATEIWGLVGQGILKEDWMYRARAVIAEALAKRPRVDVPWNVVNWLTTAGDAVPSFVRDWALSLTQEPR